jgi:hypothetical protein
MILMLPTLATVPTVATLLTVTTLPILRVSERWPLLIF